MHFITTAGMGQKLSSAHAGTGVAKGIIPVAVQIYRRRWRGPTIAYVRATDVPAVSGCSK